MQVGAKITAAAMACYEGAVFSIIWRWLFLGSGMYVRKELAVPQKKKSFFSCHCYYHIHRSNAAISGSVFQSNNPFKSVAPL